MGQRSELIACRGKRTSDKLGGLVCGGGGGDGRGGAHTSRGRMRTFKCCVGDMYTQEFSVVIMLMIVIAFFISLPVVIVFNTLLRIMNFFGHVNGCCTVKKVFNFFLLKKIALVNRAIRYQLPLSPSPSPNKKI